MAVLRLITNSYLLGALENSFGVGPCLLIQAPGRRPITHQPTAFGEISDRIDRGHCVAGRKRDKLLTPSDEERVRDENCTRSGKNHRIVGGTR